MPNPKRLRDNEDPTSVKKNKPVKDLDETDLYMASGLCLEQILAKKKSLKSAVYDSSYEEKRPLMALLHKCVDNITKIDHLISELSLDEKTSLPYSSIQTAVCDICFGSVRRNSWVGKEVMKFRVELKDCLSKFTDVEEKEVIRLPRYVRVNRLAISVVEVIEYLNSTGFKLIDAPEKGWKWKKFIKVVENLEGKAYLVDMHFPELLIFSSGTSFYESDLYQSGKIVLQDKASCFPAYVLNPKPCKYALDATAAPGMKTSLLADIMTDKGKILAIDCNEKRVKTMKNIINKLSIKCVNCQTKDFLSLDPNSDKYRSVEYILVDPTCSGSGMVSRVEPPSNEDRYERLRHLQLFQLKILLHALKFSGVKRVVYSTCSIDEEENEMVVQEALNKVRDEFELAEIKWWHRKGKKEYKEIASKCIRTDPKLDRTNGFFVAVFERIGCYLG